MPGHGHSIQVSGDKGKQVTFTVSGRIALDNLECLHSETQAVLQEMIPASLTVDLAGVEFLDSAGALALIELESNARGRSVTFEFVNLTDKARGIMGLIDPQSPGHPAPHLRPPDRQFPGTAGGDNPQGSERLQADVDLPGGTSGGTDPRPLPSPGGALGRRGLLHEAGRRGRAAHRGPHRLLLGLILAFMSSLQLKQFGANIYVASLLAIAIVKELGPIMTAILVAGRSGSAFAAEIGTMMVNEEVDALTTMGFSPVRFLAVPKVLAAMIVVPLLTLYADFFGILGGLIVGVLGLDLTVYTYLKETQTSLSLMDLITSLIKVRGLCRDHRRDRLPAGL